ncbi:SOS response-associated peptidase family protein [Bacteriovoracaceae bacterium]|nr:SOS response-associated peptidase family protein [Bacteriovoracaceae bacterium]
MKLLQKRFNAELNAKAYQDYSNLLSLESEKGPEYVKEQLGLKRKPSGSSFKSPDEDNRIFPNTFAHVLTSIQNINMFSPMRYRIRPSHSAEEIPSKYNVFNARLDSLQSRATWNSIFMKNHGLFPFRKFYEWVDYKVDDQNKKTLIHFSPKEIDLMYAPCLYAGKKKGIITEAIKSNEIRGTPLINSI